MSPLSSDEKSGRANGSSLKDIISLILFESIDALCFPEILRIDVMNLRTAVSVISTIETLIDRSFGSIDSPPLRFTSSGPCSPTTANPSGASSVPSANPGNFLFLKKSLIETSLFLAYEFFHPSLISREDFTLFFTFKMLPNISSNAPTEIPSSVSKSSISS